MADTPQPDEAELAHVYRAIVQISPPGAGIALPNGQEPKVQMKGSQWLTSRSEAKRAMRIIAAEVGHRFVIGMIEEAFVSAANVEVVKMAAEAEGNEA